MNGMRRLFRRNAAKALVIALLIVQILPLAQACPMVGMNVSISFAVEMPEPCAGMSKQACLLNFIQADQAWSGDTAGIAAHCPVAMRIAPFSPFALTSRGGVQSDSGMCSGEPPPRVLFCRLLE